MPRARRHRSRQVIKAVCSHVWAIEENTFNSIVELMELRVSGYEFTEDEVRQRIGHQNSPSALMMNLEDSGPKPVIKDGVAVLPLYGVLAPRLNFLQSISGGTSTEQFGNWFRQAMANQDVKSILLDVDSPGGDAHGNEELAQLIRGSRGKKPIKSVITNLGASAAYYVASSADEVIVSPSADVGSIGTVIVHGEQTEADKEAGLSFKTYRSAPYKALGGPHEKRDAKTDESLQERVDDHARLFVEAVAANRGVTPAEVDEKFGRGKVLIAHKAVEAGLADRVATLQQVFDELRNRGTKRSGSDTSFSQSEGTDPMNPKIKAALFARGLIESIDASDEICQAALNAFYAGRGLAVQTIDEQIVKDLMQANQPSAKPDDKAEANDDHAADKNKTPANNNGTGVFDKQRAADLRARGKLLGVSAEDIDAAIDSGLTVEKALMQWTEKQADSEPPVSGTRIGITGASEDKFAVSALEALSHRYELVEKGTKLSAQAADMQHMSLLQMATVSLQAAGKRVIGDPEDIAREALKADGNEVVLGASANSSYNRPSDFPNILAHLANKQMDLAVDYSPATYREWAAKIMDVPDFKPKTIVAAGEFGELPLVPDGDDFNESTFGEEASWIAVDKYGDEFRLTPVMIANDDLGVFLEAAQDKVIAHELTLNRLCVNLLVGNVEAGDGVALYHANHANDRTAGAAPSTAELAAMRLLLRKQNGVSNTRKLNYKLAHLLVPEDLETDTEKLLQATLTVNPTAETGAQIFRGKVSWSVDPMLGENSAVKYYGFADKRIARSIIYCHQRGFGSMKRRMYFENKNGCRVLQVEGRMAAAVRNWRGTVRNAGTGA